ncbi:hypothetical protein J7J62_05675 [bacterium]|nr:hypothetical protein [bacterium]
MKAISCVCEKPKQITFEGIKHAMISVTVSSDGVIILTNREDNQPHAVALYWNEWENVVAAVNEVLGEETKK